MTAISIPESHHCTATEARTCDLHGTYSAQLLELVRKPNGYPKAGPAGLHSFLAPFWTKCPNCDGEIQRETDARDAEIRGGMSAAKAMAAARNREAGIPARYDGATLWNWDHGPDQQRRVWNWAREYAGSLDVVLQTGRCGVFSGAPGTGKTHLAVGLLKHVMEKGGTGRYLTVMDLLGTIKDTFGNAAKETETQAVAKLVAFDLLVIDEVGKSLDSTYELAQFFRVLDRRYSEVKPTLLVTNLNRDKFIAFVGEAVVDRLKEAGGSLLVFDWSSQRSTKRKVVESAEGGEP